MTDQNPSAPGTGSDPSNHRARSYERPDFPFRCGREGLWSLACGRGPNVDGSCGGISECLPIRKGDRWHCSRPVSAGGPCENGPKPDGGCYINRPPCRPRTSMRAKRRRASIFAFLVSLSVIVAFFVTPSGLFGFDRNLSIPGGLTAAHHNLIDGNRCELCHAGHLRKGFDLIAAVVETEDLSLQCINCHEFDKLALLPHNSQAQQVGVLPRKLTDHTERAGQICRDQFGPGQPGHTSTASSTDCNTALSCIGCHTEHKGADADIVALSDQECHQCHEESKVFDDFQGLHGDPHPPFSDGFGQATSTLINFDHAKHLDGHFNKAAYKDRRPTDCLACHNAPDGSDEVAIPSFEEGCAACHEEDIADKPLLLLAWPELETMDVPSDQVNDVCGMSASWDPEDFDPASFDIPGPIDSLMLEIDPDDMTSYGDPYQQLARTLAVEGVQPLMDLISSKGGDPSVLLAGLAPETVSRAACYWLVNQEYEGFAHADAKGWIAEPLALGYRPSMHADPTLKAWLDYGLKLNADMADDSLLDDVKISLFDPETGPGRCAACHRLEADPAFQWAPAPSLKAHTNFSHRPHLALEKARGGNLCNGCHQLRPTDPATDSTTFAAIGLATCQECHGEGSVSARCANCHDYHPLR